MGQKDGFQVELCIDRAKGSEVGEGDEGEEQSEAKAGEDGREARWAQRARGDLSGPSKNPQNVFKLPLANYNCLKMCAHYIQFVGNHGREHQQAEKELWRSASSCTTRSRVAPRRRRLKMKMAKERGAGKSG